MSYFTGRDLRTVTGRNLRLIRHETGLDPWTVSPALVKQELHDGYGVVPDGEAWRLSYLGLLLEQRQVAHYSGCEQEKEALTQLIDSLCVN